MTAISLTKNELMQLKLLLRDIQVIQKLNHPFDDESINILSEKVIEHLNIYETLKDYHIVDTNEMISSQTEISDTEVEFAGTNTWVEYNFNVSDDAESFYSGWKLGIKWYREQLKQRQCKQ